MDDQFAIGPRVLRAEEILIVSQLIDNDTARSVIRDRAVWYGATMEQIASFIIEEDPRP